ncbi:CCA tRNA nucleotidyltransferase [Thiomicrolovo sp. ZZH C-3]
MKPIPAVPDTLAPLIDALAAQGVRPVLVGGYVRDALLGMPSKDIDIECFGAASLEALIPLLKPFGSVNSVGKSFGVLKLTLNGYDLDLSLPRVETKTGPGHTGFAVTTFETFDFKTAAKRRDFTVNAIGYDPLEKLLLDPYGGEKDLEAQTLRCVNESTFVEDPLRLLRAVQFSARFRLIPDPHLVHLAHTMMAQGVLAELPKERIFEEFKKLLLKSDTPSVGLRTMHLLLITPFFPELAALVGTDLWDVVLRALDTMADIRRRVQSDPLALMFAPLCIGMEDPNAFLTALTDDKRLVLNVLDYVKYHGEPERLYAEAASDAEVMRLARDVRIDTIAAVAEACYRGHHPAAETSDAVAWLRHKAERLGVLNAPRAALLNGEALIAAGLSPSPLFKTILDAAYNAQLEGAFSDEESAKAWLKDYLSDLG